MKHLLLIGLILLQGKIFSQYTLTVNNGYGSGIYSAGDTVDIWSATIPSTAAFDKWTGDIATLESNDEWHTTLIMPSQNVAVAANFETIGNISINYEKIMGRDTLKNVYSYFPANYKGVIFCFHGTDGQASNWTTVLEYREFLNAAIADTFGFIITEAEEVTKQTDFDHNGKLRWASYPMDSVNNVDYANIKILMDTFRLRGITNGATKYYAVGMSNGGAFAPPVATAFNWRAAVSYCASATAQLFSTSTVPVQWCMAQYDNNPQVGPQGNADALTNHDTLISRDICSKYFIHDHSPVYAGRFMRTGTINQTQANNLLAEFQTNNLVDGNNYLLYFSDTIAAKIAAAPSSYPVFLSLTGAQRLFVGNEVDVMYAAHQFYSDYNKKTLRFFDMLCDTVTVVPTYVVDINTGSNSLQVYPNPANNNLNVMVGDELLGEEIRLFDLSGKLLLNAVADNTNTVLDIRALANGIYFLKITTTVKKVVKK